MLGDPIRTVRDPGYCIAGGAIGTIAAERAMQRLLFGVSGLAPITIAGGVSVLLLIVAAAACDLAARRRANQSDRRAAHTSAGWPRG